MLTHSSPSVCVCAVSVPGFVSFLSVCLSLCVHLVCLSLSLLGFRGCLLASVVSAALGSTGGRFLSPGPCPSSARAGAKLSVDSI